MIELFDFQTEALSKVRSLFSKGHRNVVSQMPTGAGKTVMAAHFAKHIVKRGGRVWMTAHRRELVGQAAAQMRRLGLDAAVLMSDDEEANLEAPIQIVSVDTFAARARRGAPLPPPPMLRIDDECHHATASKYDELFGYTKDSWGLGFSATPYRLDGTGLKTRYDEIVMGPPPRELVKLGRLVPFDVYAGPAPDLSGVRTNAGDWARAELQVRTAPIVGKVVETYQRVCAGRRAICFAVNVHHSRTLVEKFQAAGVLAEHIDADTPKTQRRDVLRRFASGEIQIVCNVELITEGFDVPACDVAILARPTKSESLFLQMCGRAGRSAPGKTRGIILDHGGNVWRHGDPLSFRPTTLDGRMKRGRTTEDIEAYFKLCPSCLLANAKGSTSCRICGTEFLAPLPKVDEKVELSLVEPMSNEEMARLKAKKRSVFYSLQNEANKEKKSAWSVSYKYKARFGVMPHDDNIFDTPGERTAYWSTRKKKA